MNHDMIFSIGAGAILGIIGYFLKDIRSSIREQQKSNQEEIKVLRADLEELRAELPEKFVLRDDYIRTLSNLENKIERNFDAVNKKLDKTFETKTEVK